MSNVTWLEVVGVAAALLMIVQQFIVQGKKDVSWNDWPKLARFYRNQMLLAVMLGYYAGLKWTDEFLFRLEQLPDFGGASTP